MYSLKLVLNIQKDARNRWNACNKSYQWMNRSERIDKEIADKLIDKTQEEAFLFLIPYLEELYKKNEDGLNKVLKFWQEKIDTDIDSACRRMENVTGKKIYKNDFIWYLTTFPRMPYNYKEGTIYICCMWSIKNYMGNFLHELLHFQFIHYFTNHPSVVILNKDEFEFLKESLTFILNYEFKEFLWKEDIWYVKHKELREKMSLYWENNKKFEDLVIYWANELKKI